MTDRQPREADRCAGALPLPKSAVSVGETAPNERQSGQAAAKKLLGVIAWHGGYLPSAGFAAE